MIVIQNILRALLLIIVTSGCTPEPILTESMLRREAAEADVQLLVSKAENMMTPQLLATPYQYLDELMLIDRALHDAKLVYKKAKIVGWENQKIDTLENNMQALKKPLAISALDAFETSIERSLIVKQKKSKVEGLPQYDKALAKKALYEYVDTFNRDQTQCCIQHINLINQFLLSEKETYASVIKLTHNTLHYMGKLIRGEVSESALRQKVKTQRMLIQNETSVAYQPQNKAGLCGDRMLEPALTGRYLSS